MRLFKTIFMSIDKIVLIFSLLVMALSLFLVYTLWQNYNRKETIATLDTMLLFSKNMLEEEQQRALSLSLLLSQDKELLSAYFANNRKRVDRIIYNKIESLARLQGYRFDVQVHDKNLQSYLRSWDYSEKGEPLASFREGLVLAKKSLKPLVSIEVGKRLNIKAISPIIQNGNFAGSIEVIEGFGHLRKRLAEQGFRLYIVLHKKFLPIAKTLSSAPGVGKEYLLVGSVEDMQSFDALKSANLKSLGSFGYFTHLGYLFGYFDLRNYDNERVGYLFITPTKRVKFSESARHESIRVDANKTGVIIR
jgi:dsDNA-binding SOS-regulon protein